MASGGKRWLVDVLAALTTLILLLGLTPATSYGAATGTSKVSDAQKRRESVTCVGDPATSERVPVLLVHGTALNARENWAGSYLPPLVARGHAVCTVELPFHATGDVQTSMQYVATAIRDVHRRADRPIAVLGHSQGATLPRATLRVWPELAPMVDDVIGLAGVYDSGSAALRTRCDEPCVPAVRQLASGSRLLRALARRPLPGGPSYTGIGTLGDTTVTPQPSANEQAGTTAIEIQDVCAGRTVPLSEHALLVGDAVAYALVLDALDHTGPADASRVDPATCAEVFYPTFQPEVFLATAPLVRKRTTDGTTTEPPVRCFVRQSCADSRRRT